MLAPFLFTSLLLIHPLALSNRQAAGQNPQAQDTSSTPSPTAPAKPVAPKSAAPVKVWTNEDLSGTGEPPSRSTIQKKGSKPDSSGNPSADSNYASGIKKQLDKLQDQLADTEKQLAGLKNFSNGENVSAGGVDVHKGINRTPIDQQITSLELKKKQLQDKIGDLLDEARKKGVEPGQLR